MRDRAKAGARLRDLYVNRAQQHTQIIPLLTFRSGDQIEPTEKRAAEHLVWSGLLPHVSGDRLSVERGVKRGRTGKRDGESPSRPWRSVESRVPAAPTFAPQETRIFGIFRFFLFLLSIW